MSDQKKTFVGAHGYKFSTYIDGDDLCADDVMATAFGYIGDGQDNGLTASGLDLHKHLDFLGCALPMPSCRFCKGAPFPPHNGKSGSMAWLTTYVVVKSRKTGKIVTLKLCDYGPGNGHPNPAAIDLTGAAALIIDTIKPSHFEEQVDIRILGAAKWMS